MSRRMIFPILLGLIGAAILLSLGFWQVQRLSWKQAILNDIGARISAAPVSDIPAEPQSNRDRYLSVAVTGEISGPEIQVLASRKKEGPGFRVISAITVADRRFLVDRGFIAPEAKDTTRPPVTVTVSGNLHWPQEVDGFTPSPDLGAQIWFARDVSSMAAHLNTEPVLIVARSDTGGDVAPHPVDTTGVPNDHLGYAITWFSLAVVWLGMTAFMLWRIKQRTD